MGLAEDRTDDNIYSVLCNKMTYHTRKAIKLWSDNKAREMRIAMEGDTSSLASKASAQLEFIHNQFLCNGRIKEIVMDCANVCGETTAVDEKIFHPPYQDLCIYLNAIESKIGEVKQIFARIKEIQEELNDSACSASAILKGYGAKTVLKLRHATADDPTYWKINMKINKEDRASYVVALSNDDDPDVALENLHFLLERGGIISKLGRKGEHVDVVEMSGLLGGCNAES